MTKRKVRRIENGYELMEEISLRDEDRKYNAPVHFGESIDPDGAGDTSEILPVSKPKFRRAKARKKGE